MIKIIKTHYDKTEEIKQMIKLWMKLSLFNYHGEKLQW